MLVTLEEQESTQRIRLQGGLTVACAAHLKELLVTWAASGKSLELDFLQAGEIDISVMQLIWSAARHAAGSSVLVSVRVSSSVLAALQDAGFNPIPGVQINL